MLALLALCIAAFPVIDLAKGQDSLRDRQCARQGHDRELPRRCDDLPVQGRSATEPRPLPAERRTHLPLPQQQICLLYRLHTDRLSDGLSRPYQHAADAGQPDRGLLLRPLHLRLRDPAGLCLPLPWFPGLVGEYRRLPDRGLRLRGVVLAPAGEAGAGEPEACRRGSGEGSVLRRPPAQGPDAGSKKGRASQVNATGICRYRRRLVMVARPCFLRVAWLMSVTLVWLCALGGISN